MLFCFLEIPPIPHNIIFPIYMKMKYELFSGQKAKSNWVLIQNLEIVFGWNFIYFIIIIITIIIIIYIINTEYDVCTFKNSWMKCLWLVTALTRSSAKIIGQYLYSTCFLYMIIRNFLWIRLGKWRH